MSKKTGVVSCFILFLLAFGLRQAGDFFFSTSPSLGWLPALVSFAVALMVILFIRSAKSGFQKHGFSLPRKANRLLAVSVLLAVLYVIVVLFVPGGMSGFEALPAAPWSWNLLFDGGSLLLASIAAEAVLRGYVQTNLGDAFGFYVAVVVVSAMFTVYMVPITLYFTLDLTALLQQLLPLIAESVFLCFLFKESKTLLCTIAFATTVALLVTFTPLAATSNEYATPIAIATYLVLIPVMQSFVSEVREQDDRLDARPVLESE